MLGTGTATHQQAGKFQNQQPLEQPLPMNRNSPVSKPPRIRTNKLAVEPPRDSADKSPRWTFLTNHAHVLALLHANPELILRDVAAAVGITERAVQHIVHDLVEDAYIERKKVGRQNHYRVITDQPLRHPIEAHRTIGDLLKLINK